MLSKGDAVKEGKRRTVYIAGEGQLRRIAIGSTRLQRYKD